MLIINCYLVYLCLASGVYFTFAHSLKSRVWQLPIMICLMSLDGVCVIDLQQRAWIKRPADWEPDHGDIRSMGVTRIFTNNHYMRILEKRCTDGVKHSHGSSVTSGAVTSQSDVACFPELMTLTYALAVRSSWLQGSRPESMKLPEISVEALQKDIALKVDGTVMRALTTEPKKNDAHLTVEDGDIKGPRLVIAPHTPHLYQNTITGRKRMCLGFVCTCSHGLP